MWLCASLGDLGSLSASHITKPVEPKPPTRRASGERFLFGKISLVVLMFTPLPDEDGLRWALVPEVTR